ncbi:hypothetical protein PENTCL1PPCAC_12445, partial [Pristionchus entomophagus]
IKDIDIDILTIILADSVFGSGRWIPPLGGTSINWETYADIFNHCDRFSLLQHSQYAQRVAEVVTSNLDEVDTHLLQCLQEITKIIRKPDLLRLFSERFCLPECIDALEEKYHHAIKSELSGLLAKRKNHLRSNIIGRRQKLTLRYENGNIDCSLFNDIHPVLVDSLISDLEVVTYMGGNHPPGHNLEDRLTTDEKKWMGIFEETADQQQPYYYLLYFNLKAPKGPELNISDRIWSNGWLVGVVTDGFELLPGNRGAFIEHSIDAV